MTRSRRLATLTTCAALAGGGLLAGCGEDEPSKTAPAPPSASVTPSQAFAAAAKKTSQASSYTLTSTSKIAVAGKPIEIKIGGKADLKAKRTSAQLDFSSLAKDIGGSQVDQVGGPDALKGELISDLSGGGLKAYIKLPALNALFGKLGATDLPPYGVVDLGKVGKVAGVDLQDVLAELAERQPGLLAQLQQGASAGVTP